MVLPRGSGERLKGKTVARTVVYRDGKLAVGKVGEGWVLWGYRSRAWV